MHTPGPWEAHIDVPCATVAGHIIKTVADPYTPVALVPEGTGAKGAAAPELLIACRAMLTLTGGSQLWTGDTHAVLQTMEAVVAKATKGGS